MLGCALYELTSLEKPFIGDSINVIANKIINEPHIKIPDHYSTSLS